MKTAVFLFGLIFIFSCAGKPSSTADAKKNQPVISVLDGPVSASKDSKTAPTTPTVSAPTTTAETPAMPASPDSPKEVIKSYTAELQSIQENEKLKGKRREKQISDKVRNFFDFNELARQSLGSHWDTIGVQKRDQFSDLFTRLIEKSYLQRSKNLVGNYKVSYGNEKIADGKATVDCEIYKEDVDLEIIYELHKNSNKWMIYNVVFDQVNLIKNYQSQFNQIIAKSGINGLMDMMNKKLKEKSLEVDTNL